MMQLELTLQQPPQSKQPADKFPKMVATFIWLCKVANNP